MVVDEDSYLWGKKAPEPLVVKENDVNFAIYLNDGAMVGVFLDQKDVRKSLKEKYSKDKTVLNTFSYTGAFSMAAARGGAITTSVDLASRSLEKILKLMVLIIKIMILLLKIYSITLNVQQKKI